MNKTIKCIMLLLFLVIMGAMIIFILDQGSCKDVIAKNEGEKKSEDEKFNYTIYSKADYVATKPDDIYKYADLVIVGKYKNTNKCYMGNIQAVVTEDEFEVKNVIKGKYEKDTIMVNYYGGTVSINEYEKCLTEKQIEKRGLNTLSRAQKEEGTVSYDGGKTKVDINNNDDYLIFLSYDKEKDIYFVLADGYGMRKISEGNKIYNLDTDKYDTTITELKELN